MRRGRPSRSNDASPKDTGANTNFWDNWNHDTVSQGSQRKNILSNDFVEFDPLFSQSFDQNK